MQRRLPSGPHEQDPAGSLRARRRIEPTGCPLPQHRDGQRQPAGLVDVDGVQREPDASVVLSVCPLAGAGTGSLVSSDTEIRSAPARATISLRVGERSPRSIRLSVALLIPASSAIIRNDLPRSSRTRHSRHPIVRASSPSTKPSPCRRPLLEVAPDYDAAHWSAGHGRSLDLENEDRTSPVAGNRCASRSGNFTKRCQVAVGEAGDVDRAK